MRKSYCEEDICDRETEYQVSLSIMYRVKSHKVLTVGAGGKT